MKVKSYVGYRLSLTKQDSRTAFMALIAAFIAFLVIRDIGGQAISKYVFIGIALLVFLTSDQSMIVAFLAFITPLSLGLSYTFITFISLFFFLFKSERIEIGKSVLFPFAIVFLELVNSFMSPYDTVPGFFRSIEMIVLLSLVLLDKGKSYNYRFILKMYLFGFVVLTFFTVFWVVRSDSLQQFLQTGTTLGHGLVTGVAGDKIFAGNNDMGLYAAMTIAVSLLLFYIRVGNRLILSLLIGLGFLMGFVSTSRGFVFSFILCLLLYVFSSARSAKEVPRAVAVVAVLSLLIALMVSTVLHGAYITFADKMGMADFSNGRVDIFEYYNNVFLSSPKIFLIGVGIHDYFYKCGASQSIHNAEQEILIAWGIVGFVCVVGFFSALYQNAVRQVPKEGKRFMYLIPAIVYLFYVQFNQLFSVRSVTIMVIVVYSAIALNSQISREEGR